MWTINEVTLTATAANDVQVVCTSPSTKMTITEGYSICWKHNMGTLLRQLAISQQVIY